MPEGGSDPTKLLGGSAAKKWGRSRPFQSFFHGDFCCVVFCIAFISKELPALAVKKPEKKKVQGVILTFFTLFPESPVQARLLDEAIPYRNAR